MAELTSMQISKDLKEKLKKLGKKGQSYEDIIQILLDNYKKK